MEYNEERCIQHGKAIEDIEKMLYGSNGNKGLKYEVASLMEWRQAECQRRERAERLMDKVVVTLIIQTITLFVTLIVKLVGKI